MISFLAGSFVPLGSEAYILFVQHKGVNSLAIVLIAGLGNTLGGMSCFYIARYGGRLLVKKYLKYGDELLDKWESRLANKGEWTALFCWLPIVGEVIATVLGLISHKDLKVLILMFIGKAIRYLFVLKMIDYLFFS